MIIQSSLMTVPYFCHRSQFTDTLVLPFLWAQDGFEEPSEEMAEAIKFGVSAPGAVSRAGGVGLVLTGGIVVLAFLTWYLATRRIILVPTPT